MARWRAGERPVARISREAVNRAAQPRRKDAGTVGTGGAPGWSGRYFWVWAEWGAILRDRNRAYAANCAQWWTATGPIHAYLKRYRDYLVQERTPYYKKITDEPKLEQYKLLNIPTAGYRTTADYEAAELYLKMASQIFSERSTQPRCSTAERCEAMY